MKYTITVLLCALSFSLLAKTGDIVVTIKPLHSLVSGVLGDSNQAKILVTGNTSPHNFHLKPSHVRLLQNADVVFYIDEEFENFLHKTLKTLPSSVKKIGITDNKIVDLLPYRDEYDWEERNKEHKEHKNDDMHEEHHEHHEHHEDNEHNEHNEHNDKHDSHEHHDEDHDNNDSRDHHDEYHHGKYDLHLWLDPQNAEKIVVFIAQELGKLYPEYKQMYLANAQAYIIKLQALDKELKETLHTIENRPYIVFHDAYRYFDHTYDLNPVGVIALNPEVSPSAKQLKRIQHILKKSGAKCVFNEPQFPIRLVQTVTKHTSVKSAVLDPLGTYIKNGEQLYFSLMRNLANNMVKCLQ